MTPSSTATLYGELANELGRIVDGEVCFDHFTRSLYSTDASIYRIMPAGVVIPRTVDDVEAIVKTAVKYKISLTPRGGGTSLAGQTVNHGIVIDFSKYLNKIVKFAPDEHSITVQPGVTQGQLNRYVNKHGLQFAPQTSTALYATIGGAIGNNSCGARSIAYGKTIDHVKSVDVITTHSSKMTLGALSPAALATILKNTSTEASIYRGVLDIVEAASDEVKQRFPKIMRRVGGYNLDFKFNSETTNLAKLIVGSEGTLATLVSTELNLEPLPKFRGLVLLQHNSLRQAMEAAVTLLEYSPLAVEHIGELIIRYASQSLGFAGITQIWDGEASDMLIVEVDGATAKEVAAKLERIENKMQTQQMANTITKMTQPVDMNAIWNIREAGLGLMMSKPGDFKAIPFVEDTAVPVEQLPDYMTKFDQIIREHGSEAGYYGHASVGCMHVRPILNLKDKREVDKMFAISEAVSDLVLEYGGALAAEHGDGIARGFWNAKMFGTKLVASMRDVKRIFDPAGIMNPAKIFDTPSIKDNLRYAQQSQQPRFTTSIDFSKDGGVIGAIEKCNGMGACRKLSIGSMCPSFMAVKDEEHSTRGRANLLREAFVNGTVAEPFSKRMYAALDLCIECKACKTECPSGVDMARIKSAFLEGYYTKQRVPLRAKMVASIHRISSFLVGPQAGIINFGLRSYPMRIVGDVVFGIHHKRRLPKLAKHSFASQFKKIQSDTTNTREVVFFHDTFTSFNHPQVGIAAVQLLNLIGYKVTIVENRRCCGRPMLSKGLIEQARTNARQNVDLLYRYTSQGIPIVGCEASCISMLKDDYMALLANDVKAQSVAQNTLMLEEFLMQTAKHDLDKLWNSQPANILLHVHCHQKALAGTKDALAILNAPPNYEAQLIDAGCCGMAGSFGFEREHYETSLKIGSDRLFPTINAANPNTVIAVNGISCKQQIEDGCGRPAKFISEVLLEALN